MIYWAAFALALVVFVAWATLTLDARRQTRRREDRQAYREFMQGRLP